MKTFARLWTYFRPYWARTGLAFAAMALVAVSTGAMVFFFRSLFDDVLTPANQRGRGSVVAVEKMSPVASDASRGVVRWADRRYARLKAGFVARGGDLKVAIPLLLLAALIAKNVFSYLSEFAFNGVGLAMVRDLRAEAFNRLIRQSAGFFSGSSSGDLLSRLVADVEMVQGAFGTRLADLVQGTLTIAVMLVYIVSVNPLLTLFALVVAPLLILPIVEFSKRLRRTSYISRERMGSIGGILQEAIRGNRIVKTYGMEDFESARFDEANRGYFRVSRRAVRIQALSSPLMEILSGSGLTFLFIYSARRIAAGRMTAGDFLSFLIALLTMYGPIKSVTKVNLTLQQALSSASRVFELLDHENEVVERADAASLPRFSSSICFEEVSFRYGTDDVLRKISLEIRKGETVALVGPSGAGKTSLVNLLPRFYDPTGGRVTIDGHDVRDVTLKSLRSQIGLVTQETILFSGSARSNIAYGRSDAQPSEIEAAARAARAHEFLSAAPGGYDGTVGEDAGRLSGGERQRLSIARAILKNAPILILDEATSQLDSESEAAVADALGNLMAGRTTLVIAHRLSTARRADRIVVMEKGRIVEQGTHAALMERAGLYRRLYDMQDLGEDTARRREA